MNEFVLKPKRLNKKGYTIFLILVILTVVVFWRMLFTANEASQYMRLQKKAMIDSGISLCKEELPAFELN